jgi:hypothetical protein
MGIQASEFQAWAMHQNLKPTSSLSREDSEDSEVEKMGG